MNKRMYPDGWEDDEAKFKLPWMLENLLNDGYVVWFVNGRSARDGYAKTGQQFWLLDGELTTHNVDPYHRKEVKTGWHAWRKLKSELDNYASGHFEFKIIGTQGWHTHYNGDFRGRTLKDEVASALKYTDMPILPPHFSTYELIEEMHPKTIITFHKRKQPNTNAFRASDAKSVVFQWLNKRYPDAIIVPEFGIGGVWGKNSIVDLAVFDKKKMIFVEIKAETDSFVRVQRQLESSSLFADEVWLALFESKHIPENIPLHVGIITFDSKGKINIIKKSKPLKQDKTVIGHIWTTEFQEQFSAYKGASSWIKSLRGGVEALSEVASNLLGKNSRQFTINIWRRRHYKEFIWRRDMLLQGASNVMSIARGNKANESDSYFSSKYVHGLNEPWLKDLAIKEFIPPVLKRKKELSVKAKMLKMFEEHKVKKELQNHEKQA
ncbi:hypothetical protein [Sulfurospirillum multivorans]|uniref:Uncharacterized protein n=2 Tax=Sulfurospirillum multivorans TaxID=66821 RepID=A0AA86ALW0_SULMK|nr:hypothetical protein [Sulfurospirillum multivorans]AHJ13116.1 hypothetical protein SMUL_1861 [Sulfurospirillum multivorans DSM 12446]QEH06604.1 hypothetical protein SMN_1839 [Sulfurospirillum multivorans]